MRSVYIIYSWLCLLLIWSTPSRLQAQAVQLDTVALKLDGLGVDQGLAAGMIWGILQDRQGFLWAGTSTALNRYDGYEVKKFQNMPGDSLSLPIAFADFVKPVLTDRHNNIWLTHPYQGIIVFRRKDEAFVPVNLPVGANILTDSGENIWFRAPKSGDWFILPAGSIPENPAQLDAKKCLRVDKKYKGLLHQPGVFMCALQDQIWWIANDTLYSYLLDHRKGTASLQVERKLPKGFSGSEKTQPRLIGDPHHGSLYLLGSSHYARLDTESGEFLFARPYPAPYHDPVPKLCDAGGYIWLFFDGAELFRLQAQTGRLDDIRISGQEGANFSTLFKCNHLLEDKDGNIWMGTAGYGLFKYPKANRQFGYFGNNHTGPSMGALFATSANEVAFSQKSDIFLFNKSTNTTRKLVNTASLLPPQVRQPLLKFLRDDRGDFWVSYYTLEGLEWNFRLSETGKVLDKYPAAHDSLPYQYGGRYLFHENDKVWKIFFSSDELLSGTRVRLVKFRHNSREVLEEYSFQMQNRYRDYRRCTAVTDEWIWLGLTGTGLAGFNRRTKTWKEWMNRPDDLRSLSSNQILCLLPDPIAPDSVLWVGTTAGLNKLEVKTGIFNRYGTSEGLPNEVIYGILVDDHQNFWISSNSGLFVFNPRTQSVMRTFSREDGLQHTEFNYSSYLRAWDGTFYFGGVGGLTYFNPEDFYRDTFPSQVVIKGLRLFNKDVEFSRATAYSADGFQLNKPVLSTEVLEFDHTQRMITFEFAVLDLTRPASNRFRVKLEGFSDDWVDLGTRNEATFTNLDAGTYTLTVQGCNHAGVWNENGSSIQFTVLAPWWKTWWFRLGMLVALFGVITIFFLYREKQEQRLQTLRNRISQDIHDEIGSTLTSISLFGVVAQKSLTENEGVAGKMLTRINESTTRVIESISDIVWTINSENDKAGDLINRMRAYAAEWMENGDWDVQFEPDENLMNIPLSMVYRRNIYMIFKEALNNAFKYSNGNYLIIRFQKKDKKLILTIQDNGKGFSLNETKANTTLGGNGIKNMQRRATELKGYLQVTTSEGAGTSVMLAFDPTVKIKHL